VFGSEEVMSHLSKLVTWRRKEDSDDWELVRHRKKRISPPTREVTSVPDLFVEFNSSISSLERYSAIPFILPLTPFKEEVIPSADTCWIKVT
jgi:hypothetical protein